MSPRPTPRRPLNQVGGRPGLARPWWALVALAGCARLCAGSWAWEWLIALEAGLLGAIWGALGADALMTWPSHRLMVGGMWAITAGGGRGDRVRSAAGGLDLRMGIALNTEAPDREVARRGWTSGDLARAAGLWEATISTARSGKRISPQTLRMIAVALTKAALVSAIDSLLL